MNLDTEELINSQDSENDFSEATFHFTDEKPDDEDSESKEDLYFTITICRSCKIRIYKPLIPLKLILFLWYGGGFIGSFITLYFKQRGLSLGEISIVFILSPIAQFLGTLFSGVIADKIGKSKPVLVCNFILTVLILISILLIPRLDAVTCDSQLMSLKCNLDQFDHLITNTSCDVAQTIINVNSCNVQCPYNVTDNCNGQNLICDIIAGGEQMRNFSLSIHVNGSFQVKDQCYYNVSYMSHEKEIYSWCTVPQKIYCGISCSGNSGVKCSEEISDRNLLMIAIMVLYILFEVTFSNGFRFMDVTVMSLVKEHGSDFGRERIFSISGILVLSPIAGYLIGVTSPEGSEKNYNAAFYLFIAIVLVILTIVNKLDVRINTPGKKMAKKAVRLLKNPDVVSFTIILLILGTAHGFVSNFMFWYLEEMKPPSILFGLIASVSALYGLPFLFTSNWWVNKIGATQIFILGLVGYTINAIGFSLIYDPWISLILEATNILTYHLLWVAVITHSHELAPEGLTASAISMAGSIHYHIGKSTGSLIGGLIMESFGGRTAFRVVAIICSVCAVLYTIYLFIRRKFFSIKSFEPKDQIEEDMKPIGALDET